jgi:hypothetical protein
MSAATIPLAPVAKVRCMSLSQFAEAMEERSETASVVMEEEQVIVTVTGPDYPGIADVQQAFQETVKLVDADKSNPEKRVYTYEAR